MDKKRCEWAEVSDLDRDYHDNEWGVPVYSDDELFEYLTLEGAQAGLSWSTILKKREGYRLLFDQFDIEKISQYDQEKVDALMLDVRIIRNRLKIKSTITNAHAFINIQKEFGSFSNYLWGYVGQTPIQNHWKSMSEVPATTELSDKLSKDLKKRGFKFVGSTICYAFLQATGVVNDHLVSCPCYNKDSKEK
ncbi:DNA-3-methyladenine glycosylase I [Aliivibrio sp. S4TY2]|uniref:DNA-3-methyladenine glycosylase I n=1 Tax=unclassified Aliivibrio TaxID=2645654 RepID=UPI00237803E9|nr:MULTISPECIES: DNA-3-methyladenine glycosylase I [unclassified Aliivibrio]MDD9156255.1 DNA-3-methyladenine glycosylase I [Aliivibrio sp. S4TY2]MDD9160602.1 DNA-3-methyladenine glycosylase I [Aliivibrio sp. S4TY1]MDD9163962.1 DNA-3-methyladenine glycosylase I [Aliivibrio sp. S4MY2]MDD9168063.1 DNA-3-methyladenine glycosylase I [Aliivibrio sp. S4MY4]MDD9185159.1 DNA-3-methyladenine glycosylase I [Aliivibrio sp. S4MY3]